jgi:NADH dehydrogenase
MSHRVVIVGGGFGGLAAAQELRRAPVEVTLVDRQNYHLFQPLLYQVATGGLSPANIATPLRSILHRQANIEVILGEVVAVDAEQKRVVLCDGELPFDSLILATGARHHYFGNEQFAAAAPGLKTIEDATEIRRRILTAFETAERLDDPQAIAAWLTFIVVGGGPTGVEMAGAIGELAHHTLRREFRRIDTASARVLLVEGRERVLPPYPAELSATAQRSLAKLGVSVRTETMLADISPGQVTLRKNGAEETISAHTVLWAAGVQASPLGMLVAQATGAQTDRAGRLKVDADCSLPGHASIFAIGDLAAYSHQGDAPLPGVAPVAMQQGKFVARLIRARLDGRAEPKFTYKDRGQLATVGRAAAVADLGKWRFGGMLAWLAWLFLHLILLVGFQNRILVLLQWAWNYITRNRSARLITRGDASLVARNPSEDPETTRPSDLS